MTIALDGRLRIARFMPQNPNIVCAMTWTQLFMFDCIKPQTRHRFDPNLRLTGLQHNLFGGASLAWHPIKEGYILGSNGPNICLWNLSDQHNQELGSMHAYEYTVILRLKISFLEVFGGCF